MRRKLVVVFALVGLAVPAGAEARTFKSTVTANGASFGEDFASTNGIIESNRARCLRKRTVKINRVLDGKRLLLSTDRSSRNGYWGGSGETAYPDSFKIKLKPRRLSRKHRCGGDTFIYEVGGMRAAARETFPGEIQYTILAYAGNEVGAAGNITSPATRCLSQRRLEVFDFDDLVRGPRRAFDVTSKNGYYGAFGDSTSQGVALVLKARQLRPGRRCGRAVYEYDPAPPP